MNRIAMGLIGLCAGVLTPRAEAQVSVAMLSYGESSMTGRCFSDRFLALVARETTVRVEREMAIVSLDSEELSRHPFVVMTGEGLFDLLASEAERLGRYLRNGGFVLASAGCSSDAWAASMERAIARALPGVELKELAPDHPVFHALFDVGEFVSRKRQTARLFGVEIDGRLAMLYSPQGLNDTNEVGGGTTDAAPAPGGGPACCCCNGDEVTSAKYINANALVYALTR